MLAGESLRDVVRLAMWSGPRNISTALMRSWENRSDSIVVDEPLYAHYLQVTGLDHPGRDDILAAYSADAEVVIAQLLGSVEAGVRVFYQKHMAQHLTEDVDRGWISRLSNVLLIREPREVVASYIKSRDEVSATDIGFPQLERLFDELSASGRRPLVIDSADFLRDPGRYLRALCAELGLPFEPGMLSWPAGRRDSDGVWGPYWYDAVWRSTGFEEHRPRDVDLAGCAAEVAEECRPTYERLAAARWLPDAAEQH
jgi:hypothetical protein